MFDGNIGNLQINIDHSIVGSLYLPAETGGLSIADSIIDSAQGSESIPALAASFDIQTQLTTPGPRSQVARCTFFGKVHLREVTASETIFADDLTVERTQTGCLRYCSLFDDINSTTPVRYHCQPDLSYAVLAQHRAEKLGLTDYTQLTLFRTGIN